MLTEFYLQDFSNCTLFLWQRAKSEAMILFSKPKIEPESCVQILKYTRNSRNPKNTLRWRSDAYILNNIAVNNDFVEILSIWFIFGQK